MTEYQTAFEYGSKISVLFGAENPLSYLIPQKETVPQDQKQDEAIEEGTGG